MRILITGKGGSAGSWQIRGVQIGQALGARVQPIADDEDCRWADVIIVVKRCPDALLDRVRRSGKPWIYDVVDAYPQPQCNTWDHLQSCQWLESWINKLKPTGVIWPTEMMRLDSSLRGRMFCKHRVIPHHHRPGIAMNPIRPKIKRVGYEGSPSYIDGWMPWIDEACREIGAEFVLNPPQLADLDVVIAVRDNKHSGYPYRNWKSNVKLANAQASGTPIICEREAGYVETRSGGEYWITHQMELSTMLEKMQPQSTREMASTALQLGTISIEACVAQYKRIIEQCL